MKKNNFTIPERLDPDDARVGWRQIKNTKDIKEACNRFLSSRLPKSKKSRRWGKF